MRSPTSKGFISRQSLRRCMRTCSCKASLLRESHAYDSLTEDSSCVHPTNRLAIGATSSGGKRNSLELPFLGAQAIRSITCLLNSASSSTSGPQDKYASESTLDTRGLFRWFTRPSITSIAADAGANPQYNAITSFHRGSACSLTNRLASSASRLPSWTARAAKYS